MQAKSESLEKREKSENLRLTRNGHSHELAHGGQYIMQLCLLVIMQYACFGQFSADNSHDLSI